MDTGNAIVWPAAFTAWLEANAAQEHALARDMAARFRREQAAGSLPMTCLDFAAAARAYLPPLQALFSGATDMLLLGIGGSALGAQALQRAFAPGQDGPHHRGRALWVLDNVDEARLGAWLARLDPATTLVAAVSKSGSTIETLAQLFPVWRWLEAALGPKEAAARVIAITDPGANPLGELARAHAWTRIGLPPALGGRYSLLSAVGIIPAAFLGLDWEGFLTGAQAVMAAFTEAAVSAVSPFASARAYPHPAPGAADAAGVDASGAGAEPDDPAAPLTAQAAWQLAAFCTWLSAHEKSDLVFFTYIPAWSAFGAWFAQLWAESLGKDGKGTMPIPACGATDQHSLLQMFLDGPKNKGCLLVELAAPDAAPDAAPKASPRPDPDAATPDASSPATRPAGRQSAAIRLAPPLPEAFAWLAGHDLADILAAEALATGVALAKADVPTARLVMVSHDERAAGALMALLMLATILTGWRLGLNPLDQPAVEEGKRLAKARLGAPGLAAQKEALERFLACPASRTPFGPTGGQSGNQAGNPADGQIDGQLGSPTGGQPGSQAGSPTNGPADNQTSPTDGQTDGPADAQA